MRNLTRLGIVLALLSLAASPAFAAGAKLSPAGSWQSTDGQARVKVTLCGDGTQLCAKLTGLAGEARTAKNLQLLNTYVVEQAQLSATNVWAGKVRLNGQTADGHITLVSVNTISVSGCQLGMCRTYEFRRVGSSPALADAASLQMPPRTVGFTLPE